MSLEEVKSSEHAKAPGSKAALLDAAARLFAEKGYAAVSTRELTEAAGVNLGSIQYHFGSKSKLFIETIRSLFFRRQEANPLFFPYERTSNSRIEAGIEIAFFVDALLEDICFPSGPDVCKLINREMLGSVASLPEISETLVSTIADEFYGPADERLQASVRLLLPTADNDEVFLLTKSIIGQCCFYATNKDFVQRLHDKDYSRRETILAVRNSIILFTLRGLAMTAEEIAEIQQEVKNLEGTKA